MGGNMSGALNAQGYTQAIQSKQMPDYNHITHSGIFNQNYFQIGEKAKNLLQIHHGLAISNCDLYDIPNRNYFLSLFLKSSTDGQKRTRPFNIVVALDVSGSMEGPLKNNYYEGVEPIHMNRITLAKKAILMMYEKLNGDDVFSLVIFQNNATTIIKSTFVKDLSKGDVQNLVNKKFQSGGTTISAGFQQALKNIQTFKNENILNNYEHRVVMLTDVCDNSLAGQQALVQQISDAGISTTIIGVSTDFQSSTCEKLIKVKGFNYLCAVQDNDLQTYLVDQFDYTFFPCIQDAEITLQSDSILGIQVFGSVDHDVKYKAQGNTFTVTKMKSGFPSALTINKQGRLETKGGLILVKILPKQAQNLPKIFVKINVTYSDMNGKDYKQVYFLDKAVEAQQFFADEATKKGVSLYYYTQTVRNLLKDMKQGSNVLSDSNKGFYLGKLDKLKQICPLDKQQELQNLYSIVQQK